MTPKVIVDPMLHLHIVPDDDTLWTVHPTYTNAVKNEDVGLDIPIACTVVVPANARSFKVDLGFKCNASHGWMLLPRSSISKTTLRLANSVGIIDKNYTGKILAKGDNLSKEEGVLEYGKCYFQIVAFDGVLPTFSVEKTIADTRRGNNGFGSTTQ